MRIPTDDFATRLAAAAQEIEQLLAGLLGDATRPGEIARPPRLVEAMRHAVLGGGKRLRPFLAIETARMLGNQGVGVTRAGAAIELVHCYSLVHDDLPAMDDDDLRRGKPTVHRAFDEATAILVGDGLQTLAFEVLADPATDPDPGRRSDLVLGLAKSSGIGGMVGGQMLDLAAEGRWGEQIAQDEASIRQLQAMKTGAILAFSVEAGAICGGADPAERGALLRFGQTLGAAFQVADDLLDREATAEDLGKRTGKDLEKGKATLVDLLGVEGARTECDRLVAEGFAALERFGPSAEILREAARFTVARKT